MTESNRLKRWLPESLVPGASASLILLLAINLFNYIDRQILAAVVPDIRQEFFGEGKTSGPFVEFLLGVLRPFFGDNPENAIIGLLAMAFMVTYMLAAPLFTMISVKRWWIIAGGVIVWSLASGASGLAATFGMLLLTRCLVGIGEAAYGPIAPSMLADLYSVKVRGQVMSWFYVAIPIGAALGFILGGAAAAWLGWRWAFYLVVPPGVLLGLMCLRRQEPPVQTGQASGAGRSLTLANCRELCRIPSFVLNTLGMTALTFAIGGIGFWIPSYVHEYRGVESLASVNLIFGVILVVSGILGTLTGGYVADRLKSRIRGSYFVVSGLAMIVGFPFWVAMLYLPFPWAWGCLFVACFCLFFNTGPANTIIANVTGAPMRAGAYALNILFIHAFGDVISPLVIGGLTDAWGNDMNKAFLVVSVMVLIGGLFWLWGARYLDRDTEAAEASNKA